MTTAIMDPSLVEWAKAHSKIAVCARFLAAGDKADPRPVERLRAALKEPSAAAPAPAPATPPPVAPEALDGTAPQQAPLFDPGARLVCSNTVGERTQRVFPGLYTVELPDRHYTFRVEVQPADADFAPGKTVIGYLRGQDNEGDYTNFAFITETNELRVWKRHAEHVERHSNIAFAARQLCANPAAALTAQWCLRCGRTLTVPSSIGDGYGPECRRKVAKGL